MPRQSAYNQIPTRQKRQVPPKKRHSVRTILGIVLLVVLVGEGAVYATRPKPVVHATTVTTNSGSGPTVSTTTTTNTPAATPAVNMCAGNTLSEFILVSISKQHLWACNGTTSEYDSAVVTGMELYPADLTPTGTYHIYAKETDQTLTGHDSTGSWSDPVSYWMPFLDNQYGEYGYHDATWRSASDFGNINIYNPYTAAEHGSHGCVELPLATAKWLYGWAPIGTTVTIES